jgi:acetyl-CoA carboxylase biotin carboxyl carrier protein
MDAAVLQPACRTAHRWGWHDLRYCHAKLARSIRCKRYFDESSVDNGGKTLLNDDNFSRTRPHPQTYIRRTVLATTITAPMVGKILKVEKNVGDHVDEDDVVIVMEAMKMEIPVVAPAGGTLKVLKVAPGQAVEADQVLGEIE